MKMFVFLLLPIALSFGQDRPDPRDLLSRADAPIFTAKTVRLAATQSRGFVGSQSPGSPFKIEFVRGGRGRAEYQFPVGNAPISLTVFDGTYLWEYHDLGKQYTRKPAAAWTFQSEIATIDYGRRSDNILSASYQKDETIVFRGSSVDCYVVLAKYHRAPSVPMANEAMRRVWISKDSELILRDYWEGSENLGTANRAVTTNYTDIQTDIPLPDDLFVFQPPPESKMGPPMILGGILGGIPTVRGTLQKKVDPEYSPEARAAGLQGSVILSIEIGPEGHTQNPRVIHGLGMGLDEKAIEAVGHWQYDSVPTPNAPLLHRVVEVLFRLKPAAPWVLDASVFSAQPGGGTGATTKPELRQYAAPDPALCSGQGYLAVNFNIGYDGEPSDIQISADVDGSVRDGVLKTVQSWRFRPATRNGSDSPGVARILLECRPAQTFVAPSQIYSSSVVVQPSLLFRLEPEYSGEARKAKLQGQITLSLIVEPDGKVSGMRIVRPLGMGLDEQAIGAVMQWRFKPGTKDGKPVRVAAQVTVNFRLL
ncbi:MAG: TonB family protein [Bryobacteraceae bacterium]